MVAIKTMQHHATVFVGDAIETSTLPDEVRTPSPDVIHIVTPRLAIDTVREVKRDAYIAPLYAPVRTFVIVAQEWPVESQNALLKVLEEPPAATVFILVVPRIALLLPTVRSRVYVAAGESVVRDAAQDETFVTFKAASYKDRLELVAAWAKEKDTEHMESLLRGSEVYAHTAAGKFPDLLKAVVTLRTHFGQSGAAKKMLLEDLALRLPHT